MARLCSVVPHCIWPRVRHDRPAIQRPCTSSTNMDGPGHNAHYHVGFWRPLHALLTATLANPCPTLCLCLPRGCSHCCIHIRIKRSASIVPVSIFVSYPHRPHPYPYPAWCYRDSGAVAQLLSIICLQVSFWVWCDDDDDDVLLLGLGAPVWVWSATALVNWSSLRTESLAHCRRRS